MLRLDGGEGPRPANGADLLGILVVPFGTQLSSLSPPVLVIPRHGVLPLSDVLRGGRVPAGVQWRPAASA